MTDRAVIIGGVIRNGVLTDAEKRTTFELAGYEAHRAVLVVLPRLDTAGQHVDEVALAEAAQELVAFLPDQPRRIRPGDADHPAETIRRLEEDDGA